VSTTAPAATARPDVSVIIPVTSEDVDVRTLVLGFGGPLREQGYRFEFLFVLDGMSGRVVQRFEEEAARLEEDVKIVRLQGDGLGESIALSAGAGRASGNLLINAPQYLQIEPDDILHVVRALESGADFVATWRIRRVDPWLNRLQSRLFNRVLRFILGTRLHDLNSGLRGMRRQVLEEVAVYGDMYRFLPVLAQRKGFRVVEVKVRHREEKGRSGFYGVGVYVRRMLDILAVTFLTRFTQKPLRFFGLLGVFAMLIGFALCVEPLYAKFLSEAQTSLLDRPIIILGVVLIAFGVQLIGFGLVGEIIIFTQANSLRDYKIDEILEGTDHVEDTHPIDTEVSDSEVPLRVRELLPGEDARWDAWVRRHPQGTFFHLSGWRRVVEETFGHKPHYLVAEQGRVWHGVLPLFYAPSPLVGDEMVSVPYAVYGGVLAGDPEIRGALYRAGCKVGGERGAARVQLRHLEPREGGREGLETQLQDLYLTFRKELPKDPEEVMPGIPKKARAEVRRAMRDHGLEFGESENLDRFHDLFARDKHRLGSPALPMRWFSGLREEFGRDVVLHEARLPSGEVIAMVMSFVFRDTLYAYYSGVSVKYFSTGVNNFIYCKIMEWCVEQGLRVFDFGRSRKDSGVVNFKRHMGFEPTPLHYEYFVLRGDGELPQFNPSNPRLSGPRTIWSKLPLAVTNRLGGRLSRYLP
jgi:FemAB-related protein (PEP-CTERM system-associated)